MKFWGWAVIVGSTADWITTMYALRAGATEANPLVRSWIESPAGGLVKVLGAYVVVRAGWRWGGKFTTDAFIIVACIVWYAALHNVGVLP